MGYSRKNPHPHDGRHAFWTPPSSRISKTARTPLHSGFPTSNTPAPMWIYIKYLDAKIFIYYKCTGLFVAFRWSFFIIYDTRLWV